MAPKITQDGDHWTIGAMQFESQQAAELYLESRQKPSGAGAWATFRVFPWYVKAVAIFMALAAIGTATTLLTPRPAPASAQPSPAQALMYQAERVATRAERMAVRYDTFSEEFSSILQRQAHVED